jgi:hypothetical protein
MTDHSKTTVSKNLKLFLGLPLIFGFSILLLKSCSSTEFDD